MAKNTKKKKAFTLTELLVVVVVVGVLAAITLPKFTKIMEVRKTTEAEQVMAAVRTEQEYRCAMDRAYTENFAHLSQTMLTKDASTASMASTKHFGYTLEPFGILARRTGQGYTLHMPSYADGRICCEGNGCSNLNKDYPSCAELQNKPDFQVAVQCDPTGLNPDQQEHVVDPCDGVPVPPDNVEYCEDTNPNTCGTITREYWCEGGTIKNRIKSGECTPSPDTKQVACGEENGLCGYRTTTYVCGDAHSWVESITASCNPKEERESCGEGALKDKFKTRTATSCDNETGTWTYSDWDTSECETSDPKTCSAWAEFYQTTEGPVAWGQKCYSEMKIKDTSYAGTDVTEANFADKCCKTPTSCSMWGGYYNVGNGGNGSNRNQGVKDRCREDDMVAKTSGANAGVTLGNFTDMCCQESPWHWDTDYVVEVDYSRKYVEDRAKGHGTSVLYYTVSGMNDASFAPKPGCMSGSSIGDIYPSCYVGNDCGWGTDCFSDTSLIELSSLEIRGPQSSTNNGECFDCNDGKCPKAWVEGGNGYELAGDGYFYSGGDGYEFSDFRDINSCQMDGFGNLGPTASYTFCTNEPMAPSTAVQQIMSHDKCVRHNMYSCNQDFMDLIAQADAEFYAYNCGGGGGLRESTTCTSKARLYFRPRISIRIRHYCKKSGS